MSKQILAKVADYYTRKLQENGENHLGLDWNSKESQFLRFKQLAKIIEFSAPFSVIDYGSGLGDFVHYLNQNKTSLFNYIGFDLSKEMIEVSKKRFKSTTTIDFTTVEPTHVSDYLVASGIFNVMPQPYDLKVWEEYMYSSLNTFNQLTSKGFAFNVLTSYSDTEFKKDYLYYADPLKLFDYCKKTFSRNVALLHDYNLYEFTILVRK